MSAVRDEHGRIVFSDVETAEAWVGETPDDRAVGCPECHRVHWDGDDLVCCDTGQALPLVGNGHRWRLAPTELVLEYVYPEPAEPEAASR